MLKSQTVAEKTAKKVRGPVFLRHSVYIMYTVSGKKIYDIFDISLTNFNIFS